MNIRFLHNGEPRECEADELLRKLHKASNEYVCKTGRAPTHLVLGDTEFAQFHGYVQAMTAMGLTRELHQTPGLVEGPTPKFSGLTILRSSEESLVMAVELETRKLTGAALAAAARCQEFQHRYLHES